jgi:transposase-like protein
MRQKHSRETKQKVLALGLQGMTYPQIQQIYPIPKSTLSHWFKDAEKVRDRSKQLEDLVQAREKARVTIMGGRIKRLELAESRARNELVKIPLKNISVLKSMLAMLYWAEGTKGDRSSGINFVNTDPLLLGLYISLLRECYLVDEGRFRIGLHLHGYHDHGEAIKFWSKCLNVQESQFWKIYVKKRSTENDFRRNFQGICTVYYGDAEIRRELLALGRQIAKTKLSSFNG